MKCKLDPNEAPEGCVAVLFVGKACNACANCYFADKFCAYVTPCTAQDRIDGCNVIFKQIEPVGNPDKPEVRVYSVFEKLEDK